MGLYFDENESIYYKLGSNIEESIKTIANRYIANNPANLPKFRPFCAKGIKQDREFRYNFNLKERFPEAKNGEYAYSWAKLWSDEEQVMPFAVTCYGPIKVFVNGEMLFKSNIAESIDKTMKKNIQAKLIKGWNSFVIQFTNTTIGFGGLFGTDSPKGRPMHFLSPSKERIGHESWVYTEPGALLDEKKLTAGIVEKETGTKWYPLLEWNEEQLEGQIGKIYGLKKNNYAFAWTKVDLSSLEKKEYVFKGHSFGSIEIYVNDQKIYQGKKDFEFSKAVLLDSNIYNIFIKTYCGETNWGFELEIYQEEKLIRNICPYLINGSQDSWMYLGPFNFDKNIEISEIQNMWQLYETGGKYIYWRLNTPETWVRPYVESNLFGKWSYPLGVTLYGLLDAGVTMNREDYINYVESHIKIPVSYYKYSLWDKEQFGAPGLNNQLADIDCLDDCGSCGSAMLELIQYRYIEGAKEISDYIANFIHNEYYRTSDGAFYRKNHMHKFVKGTMWADDLYMSIPFLCRYYRMTDDMKYINDAANQLLLYKKYLYIPEHKIMSHVYHAKFNTATFIPWGRGNGWAAFSLAELLSFLPEQHEKRDEILEMFNDLCGGYYKLQDKDGMWHQVLTDFESYQETSCTSMFVYAFAKGIRFGWIKERYKFIASVNKGWDGLTRISVDGVGNVYGVCRGSGYSFDVDYYKNDLSWNLNDTHGIGIVMLAGLEVIKMRKSLKLE